MLPVIDAVFQVEWFLMNDSEKIFHMKELSVVMLGDGGIVPFADFLADYDPEFYEKFRVLF